MAEKDRIRKKQIRILLTSEDYIEAKKQSLEKYNDNMAQLIRDKLVNGLIINYDTESIENIIKLINSIGNNINQIAKRVHERGGIVEESDLKELEDEYEKIFSYYTENLL